MVRTRGSCWCRCTGHSSVNEVSGEKESLRALIGGRWAVSWQGFLMAWPFAVMFIFSSHPSTWISDDLATGLFKGLMLGTGTYLGVGAALWLFSITILRSRREKPVPVIVVVIVGGLAWIPRTLLLLAYMQWQGITSAFSPAELLALAFIQGAIAVPLAAWFLATIDRFYSRRRALLNDLVCQKVLAGELTESLQVTRTALLQGVQATVKQSMSQIDYGNESGLPSASGAHALQETSRTVSRALAHDLWRMAERGARLSPLAIIRSTATHRPFAYWGIIPIVILSLYVLPRFWPRPEAMLVTAVLAIYAVTVSVIANTLSQRINPRAALVTYGVAVFLLICTAAVLDFMALILNLPTFSNNAVGWLAALDFGVFYPLVGIAAHVGTAQEDVLVRLRQSISDTEIRNESLRNETERMYREVAVSLHGGLQGNLMAASMRLQQALDVGDEKSAHQAIADARALINLDLDADSYRTPADLPGFVESLTDAWSGLVNITTTINVHSDLPMGTIRAIQDVINEGINNAIRHGDAQTIDVRIAQDETQIVVTITDNGIGVSAHTNGMGLAMLDSIAPHAWSLDTLEARGAVLTVKLPVFHSRN